jgi:choline monooxygenase
VILNLEGRFYSDPAIFQAERKSIFARAWQPIAHEDRLPQPGDYFATRIAGTNVFLIRGADGAVRGFINVCRHRGAKLLEDGPGHCGEIRCPFHDWRFDQEGRLRDTPWYGHASPFELRDWPLLPVHVRSWRRLLFVALDPQDGLEEQLGDLPGQLAEAPLEGFQPFATQRFEVATNWKTYIDQFVENYHVPSIHSPDKSVAMDAFTSIPKKGMMVITTPAARAYGGKWLWGWPNWTLSLFAGGMKTSRINPLSAERFEAYFDYYFTDHSAESEPARRHVAEATESIFREDVRACELVQPGYSSGAYRSGPLHPELEASVAYFQRRVRDALDVS